MCCNIAKKTESLTMEAIASKLSKEEEMLTATGDSPSAASARRNNKKIANTAKKRKHRRGRAGRERKKLSRKIKFDEQEDFGDSESEESMSSDFITNVLNEPAKLPEERRSEKRKVPLLRRPLAPKAPMNSTQFLIEDHELFECDLYQSFETPPRGGTGNHSTPKMQSPLQSIDQYDVNFEYDSPGDINTVEFLARDFENEYRVVAEERLHNMSREALMKEIAFLEAELQSLRSDSSDSDSRDDNDILAELLEEYRNLKVQNTALLEEQEQLKMLYESNESSGTESMEDPC